MTSAHKIWSVETSMEGISTIATVKMSWNLNDIFYELQLFGKFNTTCFEKKDDKKHYQIGVSSCRTEIVNWKCHGRSGPTVLDRQDFGRQKVKTDCNFIITVQSLTSCKQTASSGFLVEAVKTIQLKKFETGNQGKMKPFNCSTFLGFTISN